MSDDSVAILLLCAGAGVERRLGTAPPLSNQEWTNLAEQIRQSSIERPGRLLSMSAEEIQTKMGLPRAESERIARLLSRGGQLAMEIDRWSSAGMWARTRADAEYPGSLKRLLRRAAPAALFGIGDLGLLESEGPGLVVSPGAEDAERFGRMVGAASAEAGLTMKTPGAAGSETQAAQECLTAMGRVVLVGVPPERALGQRVRREAVMDGRLCMISTRAPGSRPLPIGERIRLVAAICQTLLIAPPRGAWAQSRFLPRHGSGPPLFVWASDESGNGAKALLARGAKQIPRNASKTKAEFRDWLRWVTFADVDKDPSEGVRPNAIGRSRLYALFIEALSSHGESFSPREVATELGLMIEQAQAWLDRAVREGVAEQVSGRYRVALQSSLLPLIDPDRGVTSR